MDQPVMQEQSKSVGRQYSDDEWNKVKQPFYHYYVQKNLSLKEAAKLMSEKHGFDATLRQWERRIAPEKWNFSKYEKRDDRLRQLEAAGKSLLDVGQRGRRKSTGSPDTRSGLLEDRNMRRFARRELSREPERQRARSVSGASDASDQEMTGTSAAPSPAPSDHEIDTQHSNKLFPDMNYDNMTGAWMPHTTSFQNQGMKLPDIRINAVELAIPQITFSGPEGLTLYMASTPAPSSIQPQVDIQLPHEYVSAEPYESFRGHTTEDFPIFDDLNPANTTLDTHTDWNNTPLFDSLMHRDGSNPESFSFKPETDTSFTSFLLDDVSANPSNVIDESHLNALINADPHLSQPPPTSVVPEDYLPDLDNTHDDVHELLKQHYSTTMQMIKGCLLGCANATSKDVVMKEVVMNHLRLLEGGVQAQNMETDRNLRNTLKNITTTQRRATRSIYDLSSQRRKKIDELKEQLALSQSLPFD